VRNTLNCVPLLAQRHFCSTSNHTNGATPEAETEQEKPLNEAEYKYKNVALVDRRGLFKSDFEEPPVGSKPPSTPFIEELKMNIGVRGVLSVNEWMRQCLGHPEFGYYIKEEVFGSAGDFVTSPEISPIFGELLAVWCVRVWQKMGSPKAFRVVECGPGKGSLMKHWLRVAKRFPSFRQALKSVHLVETSPKLREIQQQTLQVALDEKCINKVDNVAQDKWGHTSGDRVMVRWHWQLQDIPRKDPVLILANEFFDALPIHQFQYTSDRGWMEKMVDLDVSDGPNHFRWVLTSTPAANNLLPPYLYPSPPPDHPKEFERSFIGMSLMQEIAQIIRAVGGAALVLDYGEDRAQANTLQAVADHKFVDVLNNPGKQDITAHVDFSALREAVESLGAPKAGEKSLVVHKVVRQRILLRELGFINRLNQLIELCKTEEEKERTATAIRLIEDDHPYSMGTLFKAFCVAEEAVGIPDGFHEDA
jgi:NADH dehydrogenase [ubiquinone] 1 alpha subcomplex assembly factor 7